MRIQTAMSAIPKKSLMSSMGFVLAFAAAVVALSGCTASTTKTQDRVAADPEGLLYPRALEAMCLAEGLNLIDRSPSGLNLVAAVAGEEITGWQVHDDQGSVDFVTKTTADDIRDDLCPMCTLGGGQCVPIADDSGYSCCWKMWGCLDCDSNGCTMGCETNECRDANERVATPTNPPDPERPGVPGGVVIVSPERAVLTFEPERDRWQVVTAQGLPLQVAATKTSASCPICSTRTAQPNACWSLPCLPAKQATGFCRNPSG